MNNKNSKVKWKVKSRAVIDSIIEMALSFFFSFHFFFLECANEKAEVIYYSDSTCLSLSLIHPSPVWLFKPNQNKYCNKRDAANAVVDNWMKTALDRNDPNPKVVMYVSELLHGSAPSSKFIGHWSPIKINYLVNIHSDEVWQKKK